MADQINPAKVGYLNPSVEQATSDYTGYSRLGADDAPRAQRYDAYDDKALKALPELWTAVNKTVDLYHTESIDQQTRDVVERTNAVLTNSDIPGGVKSGVTQADNLTAARKQGTITEDAYWMRMEMLSRSLKSKYPGHKDYVDQRMSSLTGGVPANKIRENLFQAQTKSGEIDPTRKFVAANGEYLDPATREGIKTGKYPTYDEAVYQVSKNKAATESIKFQEAEMKAEDTDASRRKRLAGEALAGTYNYLLNTRLAPEMRGLANTVQEALKHGSEWTDTQRQNIVLNIQARKQALIQEFHAHELGLGETSTINFAEYMDEKELEQKRAPYLAFIDSAADAVLGKNPDMLKVQANLLQGMLDSEAIRTFDKSEALKRIASLGKHIPGVVFQDAAIQGGPAGMRAKDGVQQDLAFHLWGGVVTPENPNNDTTQATPQTLSSALNQYNEHLNGATTKYTINQIVGGIVSPKVDIETRARSFDRVFTDPAGFLENFSGSTTDSKGNTNVPAKFKAWNLLNTPDMAQAAQDIRKNHGDGERLYSKYQSYIATGTQVVGGRAIADLKDITIDNRYKVKPVFNNSTYTWSLDYSEVSPDTQRAFKKNWDAKVEGFNLAIKPLVEMRKAEGGDVAGNILNDLNSLGFNKDEPKQTTGMLPSIWNLMKDAAAKGSGPLSKAIEAGKKNLEDGPWKLGAGRQQATEGSMGAMSYDSTIPRLDSRHNTELEGLTLEFQDMMLQMKKNPTEDGMTQLHQLFLELEKARNKANLAPSVIPTQNYMEPTGDYQEMK